MQLTSRIDTLADLESLQALIRRAIGQLQHGFLTPEQVRASHRVMGLDTQLLHDGTYLVLLDGETIAGCGGWSYRQTLFGGDASFVSRQPETLDPASDPARIRAMYTDPDYARRGVGRCVLTLCETAARGHGFGRAELMATLAGEPLYQACGYRRLEGTVDVPSGKTQVPLVRMSKSLGIPQFFQ